MLITSFQLVTHIAMSALELGVCSLPSIPASVFTSLVCSDSYSVTSSVWNSHKLEDNNLFFNLHLLRFLIHTTISSMDIDVTASARMTVTPGTTAAMIRLV